MPPHRPLLAFPIGMDPPPGSGSVQFGTEGQALEKWKPFADGRNPGTKTLATAIPSNPGKAGSSVHRREPAVKAAPAYCGIVFDLGGFPRSWRAGSGAPGTPALGDREAHLRAG